jgi:hypothetical protein
MGVLYSVYPVDEKARVSLPNLGVDDVPGDNGRNPTPAEVRAVLSTLRGFKSSYTDRPAIGGLWQAMVEDAEDPGNGGWTLINVSHYPGESEPSELWFEKGWPDLILHIMVGLANTCGPLFILPDTGETPLVVRPKDDPAILYGRWEHTSPKLDSDDDSE